MSAQVDRRRNVGPEGSVRPFPDPLLLETPKDKSIMLNENLVRLDGRYPEQIRGCNIKVGIISGAAGSCYVEIGRSKLTCAVYGPRTPTARTLGKSYQILGNVSCEINFSPNSCKKRRPHQPVCVSFCIERNI